MDARIILFKLGASPKKSRPSVLLVSECPNSSQSITSFTGPAGWVLQTTGAAKFLKNVLIENLMKKKKIHFFLILLGATDYWRGKVLKISLFIEHLKNNQSNYFLILGGAVDY